MKKHESRSHSPIEGLKDKVEEMSQEVQQKDTDMENRRKKDKNRSVKEVQQLKIISIKRVLKVEEIIK